MIKQIKDEKCRIDQIMSDEILFNIYLNLNESYFKEIFRENLPILLNPVTDDKKVYTFAPLYVALNHLKVKTPELETFLDNNSELYKLFNLKLTFILKVFGENYQPYYINTIYWKLVSKDTKELLTLIEDFLQHILIYNNSYRMKLTAKDTAQDSLNFKFKLLSNFLKKVNCKSLIKIFGKLNVILEGD